MAILNTDPTGHNPHERMTLTFAAIARARRVVFTIDGDSKRDAWQKVTSGADIPANRVRAAEIIWIVDHAAAGQ
jgi:6-phosphogluconolactonase